MDMANTDPNFKDNVEEMAKAAAGKNSNFRVSVTPPELNNGVPRYNLQVTPGDGDNVGQTYSMDITEEAARQFTGQDYNFNKLTVQNKIAKNPNHQFRSTNYQYHYLSPEAYKTSFYTPQNFPNVSPDKFNVRGDVVQTGGGFQLVLYVKPKGADKFQQVYVPQNFSAEQVENLAAGVRTEDIINLLK
jgi:hypothetical protein